MHQVEESSDLTLDDLPTYNARQVRDGISANSLDDARGIVTRLKRLAICPEPTPEPSASASPTAKATTKAQKKAQAKAQARQRPRRRRARRPARPPPPSPSPSPSCTEAP